MTCTQGGTFAEALGWREPCVGDVERFTVVRAKVKGQKVSRSQLTSPGLGTWALILRMVQSY